MNICNFGIEIDIIDNRKIDNHYVSDLSKMSGGFMTNDVSTMVDFLRKTADRLEKHQ